MRICYFVRCLAGVAPLLLATAFQVRAHNGSFAIATPVENIAIDGEFSDWPAALRRYPIDLLYTMDDLSGPDDYQGTFRLGYNVAANALYIAIEVDDESIVINTRKEDLYSTTQDGCDIFINAHHNRPSNRPSWDKKIRQYVMWGDTPNLFGPGSLADVEVAAQRRARKHHYEWRLDLNRISQNQVQIAPGMVLELEVAVWDCDEDGSCSFLTWGKGSGKGGNPNSRGDVLLVSDENELAALRGQLLWEGSDQSISLARVDVHSATVPHTRLRLETDQNGLFAAQLPPGEYRVGISGIGREKRPDTTVAVAVEGNGEISVIAPTPAGLSRPAEPDEVVKVGPGFRQGSWHGFGAQDNLPFVGIGAILQDQEGNLWFRSYKGLSRYDGAYLYTFYFEEISSILQDRQDHIWITSRLGGVTRYDGRTFTTFTSEDGLADNRVSAALEDRHGNLWVSTNAGLSRFDSKYFKTLTTGRKLTADLMVYSILEDHRGHLWFGGERGVSRFDGEHFEHFTTADGLPYNGVLAMLEDRSGNLWVSTIDYFSRTLDWFNRPGALSRFNGKRFISFDIKNESAEGSILTILEDDRDHLWFGTGGGGVTRFDGEHFEPFTPEDGLARNMVHDILEDRDGQLWFGTDGGGACRFDGIHFECFTAADGLAYDNVLSMLQDRRGNIWFRTGDSRGRRPDNIGLTRYDGKHFKTFTAADGLTHNWVGHMLEDRRGQLWFAASNTRLPFSIADGSTNSPTESGGVYRFDGERLVHYTTADGLASSAISTILEDQQGHLWFGTWGSGITRYDGRVFQHLSRKDGLAHNNVIEMHQNSSGDIWIATTGGLTRYRNHKAPPAVHIENIVGDRSYGPIAQLDLPSSQSHLAFEFQGSSLYSGADQMVYLYRLQGVDEAWRQTRTARVEYSDLPRGDYTFQIQAVDRDLNYSPIAEVKISVHLPYERIAWISALGLAIILVAWQTSRIVRRDQRLRESNQALSTSNQTLEEKTTALEKANDEVVRANQAKSAFLANMSHELRTPMNSIVNFSALILEDVYGEIDPELRDAVEEIDHNGENLLNLINDVLDLSALPPKNRSASSKPSTRSTARSRAKPRARDWDWASPANLSSCTAGASGSKARWTRVPLSSSPSPYPNTRRCNLAAQLILHIEDNASNRKIVRHIFRRTDYRLIEATDGEAGLELALREKPDLILLDIQLPKLSGYDVARRLKNDERAKDIPIIAVTSYALNGDDTKALEAGCDAYIAKPFRPQILLECLEKHLDN